MLSPSQDAPDYHTLIKNPTSLKLIRSQIKDGEITTLSQLRRAFHHLFANAEMYNRPESEIGRMAREMRESMQEILERWEETKGVLARR